MSKRMNQVKEATEAVEMKNTDLARILDEVGEPTSRGNGVVARIRELTIQTLEIKGDVPLSYMCKVASKVEGRKVEDSVVRYALLHDDRVEVYKKGRNNWVKKV